MWLAAWLPRTLGDLVLCLNFGSFLSIWRGPCRRALLATLTQRISRAGERHGLEGPAARHAQKVPYPQAASIALIWASG